MIFTMANELQRSERERAESHRKLPSGNLRRDPKNRTDEAVDILTDKQYAIHQFRRAHRP